VGREHVVPVALKPLTDGAAARTPPRSPRTVQAR
jgi:hypothetical protein